MRDPLLTPRHFRVGIVLAGLVGGAATTSGIALTATSGWLIVRASERPVLLTLLSAIVAVRAFGIARPYFRYVERVRSHDAALADLAGRRTAVYAALVPLTPARLGRRSRSSVLTGVVDDLTDIVEADVRVTVPVIASLVSGGVAVALTAALAPAVGLVLAALLLVIALGCLLAWRLESQGQEELLAARAEAGRISDLVARQAGELQAIGGQDTAADWLAAAHERLRVAVRRQSRGRALVAALILLATGLAAAAAAWLAVRAGVGAPIAALLVVTPVAVGDALAPLPEAMRAQARTDGAKRRLRTLLDQRPAVAPGPERADRLPGERPRLRLEGATASWDGTRQALPPIDLDLPAGAHIAVVGANGSGKSTLLAVLARHLDPASGRYTVDGIDVTTLPLGAVRDLLAVVDDEPHIFDSSVRENLRLARPGCSDAEITDALRRAGLSTWLDSLGTGPGSGLDTRLGTSGRGLSGGERARLAVARALLSGRPVLLLDEPVAHLDHATATAVLADLLSASTRHTVVLISHRPEGLDRFDIVVDLTPALAAPGS